MGRRRLHAGVTLTGFVIAAALSTACLAAAALSLMSDDDDSTPVRPRAAQVATTTAAPVSASAAPPVEIAAPPSESGPEPTAATAVNKDAAERKDPAAIELNVGDCVEFGGAAPTKATCSPGGSGYKVTSKAPPNGRCPGDADRSFSMPPPAHPEPGQAPEQGPLCLDINWVVGNCMDMASDAPKPADCTRPPSKGVRVTEIKQGTTNVNECSSGDRGFVYNQRRFVVCVASL
ncbi:LppU family putative lipoprotein [Nocardia thraciensis]